jgi:4a-hydroxytetrahydrobiopterin dehydratase
MTAHAADTNGITPAEFHQKPGVKDWHVTSWGPQACFRATSLKSAAGLLPALVDAGEQFGLHPDVDIRPEALVVRVPSRGAERIPAGAPGFASAVSSAAEAAGLTAAPEWIQTVDIAVAQHSSVDSRPFWAAILGYEISGETDAVDPLRRGPSLSFQPIPRAGRGRTHIDVSSPADRAQERMAAALAAGGRLVDDSRAPMWWTIASPDNHGIDIAAWTDTWK